MSDETWREPYVVEEPTMLAGDRALDYATYRSVAPSPAPPAAHPPPPAGAPDPAGPPDATRAWVRQNQARFFELEQAVLARPTLDADFRAAKAANDAHRKAVMAAQRKTDAAARALAVAKEEEREWVTGHHFSRSFRPDRAEEALKAARHQQDAAAAKIKQLAADRARLDAQVADSTKTLESLSGALAFQRHQSAEMKKILETLFGGYMAGDPAENAAEHAVATGTQNIQAIKAAVADHKLALDYAKSAVNSLEQMTRILHMAMNANRMDMYQKNGFSSMHQMQVNNAMTQAQQLAQKADNDLNMACKYSPQLPMARKVQISTSQFSQFRAMMFDSTFSDMRQGYKIQKAFAQARAAYREALNSYGWQREMCQNIKRDFSKVQGQLTRDRATLQAERTRLIRIPV